MITGIMLWNEPRKIQEIEDISPRPVRVTEVGASSFGADKVQVFGIERTNELLVGRVEHIFWYSLLDLPPTWEATTRHKESEGSAYDRQTPDNGTDSGGLMHYSIGPYRPFDFELVAAFDIDGRKAGRPAGAAIFAPPNNTKVSCTRLHDPGPKVQMGPVLDGFPPHMLDYPEHRRFVPADAKPVDVTAVLRDSGARILVNCIPVFIVSHPAWAQRFRQKGLPCMGDDIKAQIVHRTLTRLFEDRGVGIDAIRRYQLALDQRGICQVLVGDTIMTPNRVLDLRELDRPFFRETIDSMTRLIEEFPGFYLHPSKQWEYPWALENAGLGLNSRVLDVGCGASILPLYLDRLGHRVVACDIDLDWDLVGQTPIPYVKADLTDLPFERAQFEAVFCISVIEHLAIDRMIQALWELHRVLRSGGRLLLTTDFYEDRRARLTCAGPGRRFAVDWNVFDRDLLEQIVFAHPGFLLTDPPDLNVNWPLVKEQMLRFHGYPYTSIGIVLAKR